MQDQAHFPLGVVALEEQHTQPESHLLKKCGGEPQDRHDITLMTAPFD